MIAYMISAVFFIFGIKRLSRSQTARQGNFLSLIGMLIAVVAVLFQSDVRSGFSPQLLQNNYFWMFIALVIGSVIGLIQALRVQMIAMPQLVALFNGFGGLSSMLVACSEFARTLHQTQGDFISLLSLALTILIGAVTFTGSVIAYAKLADKMKGAPIILPYHRLINVGLILVCLTLSILYALFPGSVALKLLLILPILILSLILGYTFVVRIGGGDMPVVISLLNAFSGLAASMAGFALNNTVLVVAGCLVGASGVILTLIMCKAMNKSAYKLFFGKDAKQDANQKQLSEPKALSVEDAYLVLEAANSVAIIPGYGMAVAQAQHVIKELSEKLQANGCEVTFIIHPVAGRMPGHMNVLLAEADVDYEQLRTMDEMNPMMPQMDVAIVIGANDVVNPAAETDESSPIYGMPIIKAHEARTVFVLKRGKGKGYSGVENELFSMEQTRMLYGDAKQTITALVHQFEE